MSFAMNVAPFLSTEPKVPAISTFLEIISPDEALLKKDRFKKTSKQKDIEIYEQKLDKEERFEKEEEKKIRRAELLQPDINKIFFYIQEASNQALQKVEDKQIFNDLLIEKYEYKSILEDRRLEELYIAKIRKDAYHESLDQGKRSVDLKI